MINKKSRDNVNLAEYGSLRGKKVIYFYGAPGSINECAFLDKQAEQCGLHIICIDRFSFDHSLKNEQYYQALAKIILHKSCGEKFDVIGFSIGCHAALMTSISLKDHINTVHLISAAAPLDGGDFLESMAGKWVFTLAKTYPLIFIALSYWQSLLSRLVPNILLGMLFSSAKGEDVQLSQKPSFRSNMVKLLKQCFGENFRGYIREIQQYVSPWNGRISEINSHVVIWHGEQDNWSPMAMAEYLLENIKKDSTKTVELNTLPSLSHYSCLYATAPMILKRLNDR